MEITALENLLADYSRTYSAFNRDPGAWEVEHGSWPEFEHLEKSRVLFEMGRIMELLHRKTLNEGKLDTEGDLEYYSTVRVALQVVREFLEKHP